MNAGGLDRFQRLLDMTSRWDGYISIALYVKLSKTGKNNLTKDIDSLIDTHSSEFEGKVAFHLVIDRRNNKDSEFYPNNFLRNIAMENTLIDLIMNLDIDYIPSLNSHNLLQSHMSQLENNTKAVLILPSFERSLAKNEDWENITSSESKIQLINQMKTLSPKTNGTQNRLYSPFHVSFYYQGHGPTDFRNGTMC